MSTLPAEAIDRIGMSAVQATISIDRMILATEGMLSGAALLAIELEQLGVGLNIPTLPDQKPPPGGWRWSVTDADGSVHWFYLNDPTRPGEIGQWDFSITLADGSVHWYNALNPFTEIPAPPVTVTGTPVDVPVDNSIINGTPVDVPVDPGGGYGGGDGGGDGGSGSPGGGF